jgi:uncharacterized protein (DUF433 family)
MDYETPLSRITVNLGTFDGKPIIRGMRISMEMVLDLLSQGVSYDELLQDFPDLEKDDILACFAYARAVVANDSLDAVQFFA